MELIVLIVHIILAISLVGIIMIQKSEGGMGAIGGGGGGGSHNLMSGRAAANFLTKMTTLLAIGFMVTSVMLAVIANEASTSKSVIQKIEAEAEKDAAPATDKPAQAPQVPLEE